MTNKPTEGCPAQTEHPEILLPTFGENDPQNTDYAYNVVIAIDRDGIKKVLLIDDDASNNWRLPGSPVGPGQDAAEVAAGVFSKTGHNSIADVHVKDKQKDGSKNEITSFIRVSNAAPAIPIDSGRLQWWFNLESVAEQATGHTANIAQRTIARFEDVEEKMVEAQQLYDQGDYDQAITLWKLAEAATPDPWQKAIAMRNWALSSSIKGFPGAGQDAATVAFSIFENFESAFSEEPEWKGKLQSERLKYAAACGSIALHSLIDAELHVGTPDPDIAIKAHTARTHLREAARGGNTEPNMKFAVDNDPDSIRQLSALNTLYFSRYRGMIEAWAVKNKTPLKAAQAILANMLQPDHRARSNKINTMRRIAALKIARRSLY